MKPSEKLEKQISRIHDLIEQEGSEVTWNDKIPDPDNPSQLRQIDITIRRDGNLSIVECRIHKDKQDVKWIEELIGRRSSLGAQTVIAVSASSFTDGAIKKAKSFGIILRDLISLTEEEIQSWGCLTEVSVDYLEFSDTCLDFELSAQSVSLPEFISFLQQNPDLIHEIFTLMADKFDEFSAKGDSMEINAALGFKKQRQFNGVVIQQVNVSTRIKVVKESLSIPSVVAYDDPGIPLKDRNIYVEEVGLGDFQITKSPETVSASVDLTQVPAKPNSLFRYIGFDLGKKMTFKHLDFLGTPDMSIRFADLKIRIRF